ncbi:hypothetical protein [Microbacterium sp. CJ88]|uniref:hypothetical protein n=1 Tax=Microbacterium sp. CJ88 TaxID=3445672 RepID=UPI003F65F6F8
MQLGTRWTAGATPPAAVPAELHPQIAAVEASLAGASPMPRWTLTWLERRPVAELDTGVIVTIDAGGAVVVRHDVDDEFA